MIFTKFSKISFLILTSFSLTACSLLPGQQKDTKPVNAPDILAKKPEEQRQDTNLRLNFNKIKTGTKAQEFAGGSSLTELKQLYGDPTSTKQQKAGDVTLDVYTWEKEGVTISAQLFQDSTIAKSISNFTFAREKTKTSADYDKLIVGTTSYQDAVNQLGEPDALSHAVSSDKEDIQAIWATGLVSKDSNAQVQVQLFFENNKLSKKTQNNLGQTN